MKIIGHRGARGLAPENTLASIRKALEHGVDQIEFDVRVTKDTIPVLLHDEIASDAADNKLVVRDSTYRELRAHKPDLATLDEVLATFHHTVPLLIEVKPDEPTQPIVAVLKKHLKENKGEWQNSDMILGSFSQKTLLELHSALPKIPKTVIETWSGVRARIRAKQVDTKRLNMKALWLWVGFLAPMHKRGWQIAPYTINDPAKVKKWEKYLYGVITDYPDRFQK